MERTPRKLTAVLGSAMLVLMHASPASAATVVATGAPPGWGVYNQPCSSVDPGQGSVTAVAGPAGTAPPLGTGSLRFHQGDPQDLIGITTELDQLGGVTDLTVDVYDPSNATTAVVNIFYGMERWQGQVHMGGEAWTTVDLLTESFTWQSYGNDGLPGEVQEGTIADFLETHSDGNAVLFLGREDCADTTSVANSYIDALTVTVDGVSTTYDFEPATQKPTITIKVKDDTIRRGDNVVVSGVVEPALPGVKILLRRKTADGPRTIGSGVIAQNGSYKLVKELNNKGIYKLFTSVARTSTTTAAKSPTRIVTVRR